MRVSVSGPILAPRRFVASVDPRGKVIITRSVTDGGLPDAANIIKYPATQATWRKLGDLLDLFSPAECANYLSNAGYASA